MGKKSNTGLVIGGLVLAGVVIYAISRKKVSPPVVYTCPYCGATFTTQEELNQHIATVHPQQPPVFTCPYCGAIFSSQVELDAHILAAHTTQPIIAAGIPDAYIFDKHAETNSLWNGYAHISLPQFEEGEEDKVYINWMAIASRDTIIGFVLQNNSNIPVAFNFVLRQHQWIPPNTYTWYSLVPTTVAPIPMTNGIYQADKVLMPGDSLEPGQRGFIAAPATIGQRWCIFYCDVSHSGQAVVSENVKGWGGY